MHLIHQVTTLSSILIDGAGAHVPQVGRVPGTTGDLWSADRRAVFSWRDCAADLGVKVCQRRVSLLASAIITRNGAADETGMPS